MQIILKFFGGLFSFGMLILLINFILIGCSHTHWSKADRSSAGIAPSPQVEGRAVVQVYAARTYGWRGYFAVHSWLAYREKGARDFTVHHVIGWRARSGQSVVQIDQRTEPDQRWFGNEPDLLLDLRGEAAEKAIPKIQNAAQRYPYPNTYRAYPGPNSNTFIAHIIRNVPELEVELPSNAIGKDWIEDGDLIGRSESGTGVQFSLFGLLGATVGVAEGVELNILGMSFGVDIARPALKLPFIGRLGFPDGQIFTHSDPPPKTSKPESEAAVLTPPPPSDDT